MNGSLRELCCAVQRNCHISDARHGTDYGLCTYLLKMREYYRWEHGLDYGASLANESVGEWLSSREALWERLSEHDYAPLPLLGEKFDPFDAERINRRLEPLGLVYSAGYGLRHKPLFFLGHLERREEPGGVSVWVAGRELARDLMAPAAMSQGDHIYLRQESLRRMLWEKLESWRWQRRDNAQGRAFAYYDFEGDLELALEQMAAKELDALALHERGEHLIGRELGAAWNRLLSALGHSPAELMVRAVRDHWADCRVTLPCLLEREDAASIHFYLGGLTGMRKTLFPALERAYEAWHEQGDWSLLGRCVAQGEAHWALLARRLASYEAASAKRTRREIIELVEAHVL
jgi:hypothetical protein